MEIRAIFFDAVGTLIHPNPPAWEAYAELGRRFGSRLDVGEIAWRFRHFFQIEEEADLRLGLATSEEREIRRWRSIVEGVMDDVEDRAGCFTALYQHFAEPAAWRCDDLAEPVLAELTRRGYRIGMASNYDRRLRPVVAGLEPLRWLNHLVISSELGWRKPAGQFFAAVCRAVNLPAEEILFVGDDRGNDFDGAAQAGMQALLLDPRGKHMDLGDKLLARVDQLLVV